MEWSGKRPLRGRRVVGREIDIVQEAIHTEEKARPSREGGSIGNQPLFRLSAAIGDRRMMARRLLLLALVVLVEMGPWTMAQETDYRDDLQFAELLRARGDSDLALELLQRLAKQAPPALARELPLEFAKTRLRLASEEPETGKRLSLYVQASEDFRKFLAANPGHPRLTEAKLDIARVLNLRGKTELNRALLAEDSRSRRTFAQQARSTLEDAARQLQAAEKELTDQLARLPSVETITEPGQKKSLQARRARLEDERNQTRLEHGLNLYDQASTYLDGTGDEAASQLLVAARKVLEPLAKGAPTQAITWKARAWMGRIQYQTETAEAARSRFQEVLNGAEQPAAQEGIRLARYFRLLVIQEKPNEQDRKAPGGPNGLILEAARRWRNDYRRYWKSPEGIGLTFLLAQTLLAEAESNKRLDPPQINRYRTEAIGLLREVESSENEFTERARRLKINTMVKQGLLRGPVRSLGTFEQCFLRAQFEGMQLDEELKASKDPKQAEQQRKQRLDTILEALRRALSLPEAKKMQGRLELNQARSQLAYWALTAGQLEEAIQVGEGFAREDPRSSQAELAAVYALQAYGQILAQKQAKFEEIRSERDKMFALASYMEERWPNGLAGDLARHSVALQLIREENYPEAIQKLSRIQPGYGSFALVCFQIADACTRAEKAKLDPLPGDQPGDYRKRAMAALEKMPESALGADPFLNQIYVSGKAMLGRDLFRLKRYSQMQQLATTLRERLDKLRFHHDAEKDRELRNQLRYELVDLELYARYGQAEAAFQASDHAKVVELLDPFLDTVIKNPESQERTNLQKNQQLSSALLILALRANIQLGRIDRTDTVLEVLDKVAGGENAGTTNLLRLLAHLIREQIEDLRKKGDKEALARAIKGYSTLLDKRIKKQTTSTPEFARVLADCYSSMEEHDKAAAELAKIPAPKNARPGSPEESAYRRVQIDLARELRLSKQADNLKKARELLDAALGTSKNPGWGRRDLLVLKEQGHLLLAEEKWGEAFAVWSDLTKRLARDVQKGGAVKEHYLECFYQMIATYVKVGLQKAGSEERDKYLRTAALQILQFEKSWEEFGSEASKKRFQELLSQQAALREQYEALKKK